MEETNQEKQTKETEQVDIKIDEDSEEIMIKSGDLSLDKFSPITKELIYVGILFLVSVAMFKFIFSNENLSVVFKVVLSFYFLYIVPGFAIMYYWYEKLEFIERFIIGFPLGAAITGSFGFLLGLVGIKMNIHMWLIPLVCFGLGYWFIKGKNEKKQS